ncbi:hypothetical protein [Microbulbifer taiwanensis]|uniref:hypothetical protein n=1 Tax=Microbulbifer taiwanensis TaxID=986746 RepID=UPI003619F5DB
MNSFLKLCFGIVIACALYGCSGGGGGEDETGTPGDSPSGAGSSSSSGSSSGSGSGQSGKQEYLAPGSYTSVTSPSCLPFEGSENAELKILFINLNGAPYFDALVEDAVQRQFKTIAPFSDYYANLAFYRLEINDGQDYQCVGTDGGAHSGSGLSCDDDKIHQAIMEQCPADDIHGLIKIVFASSPNGGAAGEVIYIGANPEWDSEEDALYAQRNTVVHEVGHNFGLADLYGGGFNKDGTPVTGWPSDMSRQWGNLDAPGCSKWCNGFKPASEYTLSTSAACPGFGTRSECLAFNRDAGGAAAMTTATATTTAVPGRKNRRTTTSNPAAHRRGARRT